MPIGDVRTIFDLSEIFPKTDKVGSADILVANYEYKAIKPCLTQLPGNIRRLWLGQIETYDLRSESKP